MSVRCEKGLPCFALPAVVAALIALTGCGGSAPVPPPNVTVSVAPKRAAVAASTQIQPFSATVVGDTTNLRVTWSVDGVAGGNASVGTISSSGVYTPPATGGRHSIKATAQANPADSATANVAVTDLPGVFTYHNNLSRDGTNTQEYALTATNVNPSTFGKLFSCPVDGVTYTQPLWAPGLTFSGERHNVIFVATQHDSLYAFDADASPCAAHWQVNLLDTLHGGTEGETPVPWLVEDVFQVGYGYGDIQPEVGVTGTPVIDPASNTIYLVSKSEIVASGTFFQRLHALDLTTGAEKFNGPLNISASVPGIGDGSANGMVAFDTQNQHQRSGLALANGKLFVAWAAHEDRSPYHGWIMGFNASNLLAPPSVYNTTPNGGLGGIWSGGGAPAIDEDGAVYVSTGNGIFDANATSIPNDDYGDSLLKLDASSGLSLADWFTPDDQDILELYDADLGSGAIVLLPDQTTGPPHLLVEVGKEGVVYLVNRDGMGNYQADDNNQIVQSFYGAGLWGTPAFWRNNLYFGGAGNSLMHFTFDASTGLFNPTIASQSVQVFYFPGTSPSVSSQGASSAIVWAIDASQYGPPAELVSAPAILHAYNAANLQTEYWNSAMAVTDQAGDAVKFVPPTIANGKVYVSTRTRIDVYGLFPN